MTKPATAALTPVASRPGDLEIGQPRGMAVVHETASAAAAAKAQAMVQAHFLMALRNPRDWNTVRVEMLETCKRSRFAEVARYSLPRGGQKIEGWTIRFAEQAMRSMKNLMPETAVAGEDDERRILKVSVIDLEANLPLSMEIVIHKIVERKTIKDGETPIRTRINSQGQTLYILPATEDDLVNKQAAQVSKALRTMVLRLLPGDILDECLDEVNATNRATDERDPKAAVKKIADNFFALGVKPSDLKDYMGHEIDSCAPSELQHLREVFQAIRSGELTWRDVSAPQPAEGDDKNAAAGTQGQQASLKERLRAKTKPKDEAKPGQAAAPAPAGQPAADPAKA